MEQAAEYEKYHSATISSRRNVMNFMINFAIFVKKRVIYVEKIIASHVST